MNQIGTMENKAKAYCYSNFFRNDTIRLKVVGIINSIAFQKARICAEKLHQHLTFKFAAPQIIEMFQVDWYEYILERKRVTIVQFAFNKIYYNSYLQGSIVVYVQ